MRTDACLSAGAHADEHAAHRHLIISICRSHAVGCLHASDTFTCGGGPTDPIADAGTAAATRDWDGWRGKIVLAAEARGQTINQHRYFDRL